MRTFLKYYDTKKINVKYGNRNCLHILTDLLPSENYDNIAECIKILLRNGCDPNMPNEKSRTPFFSLLKIQPKLSNSNDLVDYFIDNFPIDAYTYKAEDIRRMFEKQNPRQKLPPKVEKTINTEYMLDLLRKRNETEFENNFKLFKENSVKTMKGAVDVNASNAFEEDCAEFLYTAVQNDLENVVELLINEGVDVNRKTANAGQKRPPAFLACASGFNRILKMIMEAKPEPETVFGKRNLLHEVCQHFGMDPSNNKNVNFQKCFDLVLNESDVNQKDESGCTPLHYAVRYRNDEAVKALLEKSSYIGTKNILGETPIDDISREVLQDFLDDCVTTNVRRTGDEEHEVYLNYKFLQASKTFKNEDEFRPEIAPLQIIANNTELRPLILHPVLSSFLYLKWSKLSPLFYANFLMFSIFMMSLVVYMVLCQSIPVADQNSSGWYCFFFVMSFIGLLVLMIRELFQCVLSPRDYIKSLENWFEVALIILGWIVLFQSNESDDNNTQRVLRGVTILFAACVFLLLIGTLPILSLSTHMVILRKVSTTFLKSICLYLVIPLAFALSFYTLFGGKHVKKTGEITAANSTTSDADDDSDLFNSFEYPGIAIIKTFVMLTGEFDASSLNLDRNGASYSIIFILFVFLVTIVLFNLLNALAVDDTHVSSFVDKKLMQNNIKLFNFLQVIKLEGELVDLSQRISVLNKYEKIILSRSGSWRWLKAIISIFPNTIPEGKIVIRPNKSNEIFVHKPAGGSRDVSIKIEDGHEQELQNLNNNSSVEKIFPRNLPAPRIMARYSTMDPKIMKKIRNVLEERCEKKVQQDREAALSNRLRSVETQLKMLIDVLMKKSL